jgi:TolB-like protein/DNA-binding winged helix-turn-helix (wHTH) protein/Tfp pilus assembly protein PilF
VNNSSQSPHGLRFGIFEIDLDARELRKNGLRVKLQDQPFKILAVIVCRAGEVTTREELYAELSSHSSYDFKHGLNNAIQKIREVLGDSPENARFIETVPGRGYRFLPQVEVISDPSVRNGNRKSAVENERSSSPIIELHPSAFRSASRAGAAFDGPTPMADTAERGTRKWWRWTGVVAVLAVAGLSAYFHLRKTTSIVFKETRTTGVNGDIQFTWSKDGNPQANTPKNSKVVLSVIPFVNLSKEPAQQNLAIGMTFETITQLSRLNPQRLLIAPYSGDPKDLDRITLRPDVDYLLEGSIRGDGKRVRVTVLLIHAWDQTYSWAESYDRDMSDVLKMQSDIAQAIAAEIQIDMSKSSRPPRVFDYLPPAAKIDPEAYWAYLQGIQALTWRDKEGIEAAIVDFKQSIAIDPAYAPAYVGLARAYILGPIFGASVPIQSLPQAANAASHALALDYALAEPHTYLGFTNAHWKFDWPDAEREFRKGLAFSPNSSTVHLYYAHSYLIPLGRHKEAIAEIKRALQLDPHSTVMQSYLGRSYLLARRYDEAVAQFKRVADADPAFVINHVRLAHLYAHLGRYQDAISEEIKARELSDKDVKHADEYGRALAEAYRSGGPRGYWLKQLAVTDKDPNPPETYVTPFGRAIIYAELGDKDNALAALHRAYVQRDLLMTELAITPEFDFLRQEPRYKSLLQTIGLAKRSDGEQITSK